MVTMAKKPKGKTMTQSTTEEPKSILDQMASRSEPKPEAKGPATKEKQAVVTNGSTTVESISVPLSGDDKPAFRLHVDLSISGKQAEALRKLADGLDKTGATQANGKRCIGTNDAVRWFIDQVAELV